MPPLYPLNLSLAADIEPAAKYTHSPPPQAAGQPERFSCFKLPIRCFKLPIRDAMAVANPELRVHGSAGLRVADASIMPTVVSGNPNAATIMIGERVADLVREKLRLAA